MFLYDLRDFTKPMQELANLILQGSQQMQVLIDLLKDISQTEEISAQCETIYAMETKADQIYNKAVAQLFDHEPDPIKVIKLQEVLLGLETTTDMCKDVVKAVESIMIKNG